MEEVEVGREMPFEGKKVAEAAKEVIAQGPAMIGRIMEQEVHPFIEDVQTLATSMANLYQEHAAHFILLGVRVNIEVEVMNKTALKNQVGASIFDENDINRVVREDATSLGSTKMQLHQFSDTVQDLCHEGHSLCAVHFGTDDVSYILKSIDVTNGSVTFRLQAEPQQVVHEGFLGVGKVDNPNLSDAGRQKSSKSQEKT